MKNGNVKEFKMDHNYLYFLILDLCSPDYKSFISRMHASCMVDTALSAVVVFVATIND